MFLKPWDFTDNQEYLYSQAKNIIDLYLKEDSKNIKNLCKYGLKQTRENRFEYKRNNWYNYLNIIYSR